MNGRRRTARDHLHHRGFHFHKVAIHHELADAGHDFGTHFESVAGIFVRDQIQITLTIAGFLILQAVEFVRQRAQGFGQQTQFSTVNGQLAGLGFEQLTFRAQDIAQVPFFELLVVNAFRQIVTGNVQLNTAPTSCRVTKDALPMIRRVIIRPATATSTFSASSSSFSLHRSQRAVGLRCGHDENRSGTARPAHAAMPASRGGFSVHY
jgi:hypothetical protein